MPEIVGTIKITNPDINVATPSSGRTLWVPGPSGDFYQVVYPTGRRRLNVKGQGTWGSGNAYNANDLVIYGADAYLCLYDVSSATTPPADTAHWKALTNALSGPAGATGPAGPVGMTWRGGWSSATAYLVNDVVYFTGASFIAIQAGTNQNPLSAGTYWTLIAAKGGVGDPGLRGSPGGAITLRRIFSNDTTSPPVSGTLSYNASTAAATTIIRIAPADGFGNDQSAIIDAFDDSTNPSVKGYIRVQDDADITSWAFFRVVSVATVSGWRYITVAYIASGNAQYTAFPTSVHFDRAGDQGATGATGAAGTPFSNPMTSVGDLIVGGTAGALTRLPKGGNDLLLAISGAGALGYRQLADADVAAAAGIALTKLGLTKFCLARANTGADQNIPIAAWTSVNFDGADVADANNWHNPAVNPHLITVTETGLYLVSMTVFYTAAADVAARWFGITGLAGGSNLIQWNDPSASPFTTVYTQVGTIAAGASVQVQTYQNSTGVRPLNNAWGHTFNVVKLGNS